MKIALIAPRGKADYLTNGIVDGLMRLSDSRDIEFRVTDGYPTPSSLAVRELDDENFVNYAKSADLIVLMGGKLGPNTKLAERINCFYKTVFADGSEFGKNNRLDFGIQDEIVEGTYKEWGRIDQEMLDKCVLYFRREKPYKDGIVPFPFGIPSSVIDCFDPAVKKDIDFVAIFGQDEYPPMRRYARDILKKFCRENDFICATEHTHGFRQDDKDRTAGRDNFYSTLLRSKVGISISGGGFDTVRFWEILGSNCLLLTEKIDIYELDSSHLAYERIWEFSNLFDFEYQLNKIGKLIKNGYNQEGLNVEYHKIIADHSTEARVGELIERSMKEIKKQTP